MKLALVVDDSLAMRAVLTEMLEGIGYDVEHAVNGKQALEFCKRTTPDLIMLDIEMPVMDGLEFLEQFQNPTGIPVLMCTSKSDFRRMKSSLEMGAREYIMKPFDRSILASKLEMLGLVEADS